MIEQFTKKDFESYLVVTHSPFTSLGLVDGEYAYKLTLDNQASITIRSSVKSDGLSADVGKDSIRCWLVAGNRPLGSKVSKWTTRQAGWQDRLNENIKQLILWRALAGDCKKCGRPKGIFKAKTEKNKGRPFTKCQDHNGFAWLDKPIKTSDIYFGEESHKSGMPTDQKCKEIIAKALGTTPDDITLEPYGTRSVKIEEGSNDGSDSGQVDVGTYSTKPTKNDNVQDTNTEHALQNLEQENRIKNLPQMPGSKKTPNAQQKQAIEAPIDANLRVLAGPGSGKTFVIEHRYKFLVDNGVDPSKIVVCTFGKQSATDMGQRIAKTCPQANLEQICTIHALCYRLLAKWHPDSRWYKWRGPKDWQIKKVLEDVIGPIWQEDEKPGAQETFKWSNSTKYRGLTTDDSYQWFTDALGQERGAWLYEIRSKFDAWLNRNKFLTYADQLFLVEQQLKNDESFRAKIRSKFSHIVIDEGQDTNAQALRILLTIAQSNTVLLVGDTDQMMYRFAGAEPGLMLNELEQWIPDIQTVKLETNYRSQDEIINKSQQLIANNYSDLGGPYPQEFAKTMSGVKGPGDKIEFAMYETADDEALAVGQKINELVHAGRNFGDFFIGARTRAQLGYVEGALVRAGVKFINIAGGSFWQSRHVLDVVSYLRLAHDTGNKEAFEQVHNIASAENTYPYWSKDRAGEYCPTRFLGKKFLAAINFDYNKTDTVYRAGKYGWRKRTKDQEMTSGQEDLLYFVDTLSSQVTTADNAGQIIRAIIDDCYEKYLRHNDTIGDEGLVNAKLEDLATVEDLASRYASVEKFLAYVDENIQAAEAAKNRDWEGYAILSTYHRLKGLERPVVFGLGWCEGENTQTGEAVGLLPHTFSLSPPPDFGVLPSGGMSPVEDERCIGFVCVTRAESRVYLSGIESYRTWKMWPSRFIYEMELENE